jgi:hypothetical protein
MIGLEGEDQRKAKYRICMAAAVNVPPLISHPLQQKRHLPYQSNQLHEPSALGWGCVEQKMLIQ